MNFEVNDQFRAAIEAAGLVPPEVIKADDEIHRFASSDKPHDDAGWYVLHNDEHPSGMFGCWRSGLEQKWRPESDTPWTPSQEAAHREAVRKMQAKREADKKQRQAEARDRAAEEWKRARPAPEDHAYLLAKGIEPHGLRVHDGGLVVPLRDSAGELHSLQFITDDGDKRFMTGGRVSGCFALIGEPGDSLLIAEGFATGATLYEATRQTVAVAFNAGNLEPVAKALRELYPKARLTVCADDDHWTKGNPGRTKAKAAAATVGGRVVFPVFGDDRPEGATDFNDLAAHAGLEAVRTQVDGFRSLIEPGGADGGTKPYPVEALPEDIRRAVIEVQGFTQAPLAMVASSALGALSLAGQAYADVERDAQLQGPCSLFMLTVADSGERKSTVDKHFLKAIRAYEREQAITMAPDLADFEADMRTWDSEKNGLAARIAGQSKGGKDTRAAREEMREIEARKPTAPRVPRLVLGDENAESLREALSSGWPSAGIFASEGGTMLGGHAMGKETRMRFLSLMDLVWDGGELTVGRASGRKTIAGARLTVFIQVQGATLREFMEQAGELARGIGFLARMLIATPESTQGTRLYVEPPAGTPGLDGFNARIATMLQEPPTIEDGRLHPALLTMDAEAKAEWVNYYNACEIALRHGGRLQDVRDVASKTADNAARLAGLFALHDRQGGGQIRREHMEAGAALAGWYLDEARRYLGESTMPKDMADAHRVLRWVVRHCRETGADQVSRTEVQQFARPRLKAEALTAALELLAETGHVHPDIGRSHPIRPRPSLLARASSASLASLTLPDPIRPAAELAEIAELALAKRPEGATCGGCQFLRPDQINPEGGMGHCEVNKKMRGPGKPACDSWAPRA